MFLLNIPFFKIIILQVCNVHTPLDPKGFAYMAVALSYVLSPSLELSTCHITNHLQGWGVVLLHLAPSTLPARPPYKFCKFWLSS